MKSLKSSSIFLQSLRQILKDRAIPGLAMGCLLLLFLVAWMFMRGGSASVDDEGEAVSLSGNEDRSKKSERALSPRKKASAKQVAGNQAGSRAERENNRRAGLLKSRKEDPAGVEKESGLITRQADLAPTDTLRFQPQARNTPSGASTLFPNTSTALQLEMEDHLVRWQEAPRDRDEIVARRAEFQSIHERVLKEHGIDSPEAGSFDPAN